ncbi:PadR family transcriptional regulator [Arthrobacter bambusae]|uniref:PadR family transcriptional regulator n=1 Tax=Arthrobacter TaxID=1663 RepID=UPI001F50B2AD|nr:MULTISPECIES: PadR family transcriptional regulator [Arthrobacter]MCI0141678.1 PadR family transcriptional regulator [Arthrobacter bambusae]UYY83173.1 PadR family transcriptional regulator [Arthrobacter sp. YA7-1]
MRELMRAAVRLHILHHAAKEDIHGAWMSEELAKHGYSISPGTLYPTLHRMEQDGLLVSRREVVGGRRRRVYRSTQAGLDVLADGRKSVAELAAEILPESPKENPHE